MMSMSWAGCVGGTFLTLCFATVARTQEKALDVTTVAAPDDSRLNGGRRYDDDSSWYAGTDVLWLKRDYPGNFLLASTVDRFATQIPGGVVTLSVG